MSTCKPPGLENTYYINTTRTSFDDAEATCNRYGGHLVAYANFAEQQAVEQCFVNSGYLFPTYHKLYWMGLRTGISGAQWPNFTWIDRENVIYMGDYQHWGVYQPGGVLEPNRLANALEDCAGSNLTMGIATHNKRIIQYDGVGGWADRSCLESYVFICEVQREWPGGNSWHLISSQAGRSGMWAVAFAAELDASMAAAPAAAPAVFPSYTSGITGSVYTLHTRLANQTTAELVCNREGGHLASFSSLDEQAEVEQAYIKMVGATRGVRLSEHRIGLLPPPALPPSLQPPCAQWAPLPSRRMHAAAGHAAARVPQGLLDRAVAVAQHQQLVLARQQPGARQEDLPALGHGDAGHDP